MGGPEEMRPRCGALARPELASALSEDLRGGREPLLEDVALFELLTVGTTELRAIFPL